MPPLPAPLADFASLLAPRLPKRERTRLQLVDAAIQVFSARGVTAATIQEIANVAGMTTGTVYNHFSTKDEIIQHAALWLGDTLCRRISDSQANIPEGAERMAIGNRRYIWLAEQSPEWALLLLDVLPAAPNVWQALQAYALADLQLGMQQKSFSIASEAAAMDLIGGTINQAMRTVALGLAPPEHGSTVAALVLRGLGMASDAALEVATRPLPDFVDTVTAAGTTAARTAPKAGKQNR